MGADVCVLVWVSDVGARACVCVCACVRVLANVLTLILVGVYLSVFACMRMFLCVCALPDTPVTKQGMRPFQTHPSHNNGCVPVADFTL